MKGSIRFNDAVNAEVTTDGTDITKVVNVATGEEYGGGGGGGDLSVANVTVIYAEGVEEIGAGWTIINDDPESPYYQAIAAAFSIPPGTYKCPVTTAGQVAEIDYDMELVTIEGSAEKLDFGLFIKGDCTITFNAE